MSYCCEKVNFCPIEFLLFFYLEKSLSLNNLLFSFFCVIFERIKYYEKDNDPID